MNKEVTATTVVTVITVMTVSVTVTKNRHIVLCRRKRLASTVNEDSNLVTLFYCSHKFHLYLILTNSHNVSISDEDSNLVTLFYCSHQVSILKTQKCVILRILDQID